MTRGKPDPNVWALNNQLNDLKTQLQESQFTHKNIMMDYQQLQEKKIQDQHHI